MTVHWCQGPSGWVDSGPDTDNQEESSGRPNVTRQSNQTIAWGKWIGSSETDSFLLRTRNFWNTKQQRVSCLCPWCGKRASRFCSRKKNRFRFADDFLQVIAMVGCCNRWYEIDLLQDRVEFLISVPVQPSLLIPTPDLMVNLQGIEIDWRADHGEVVRLDTLAMKDDAVEWANLIVLWLSWIHERCWEFVEW